MTMITAFMLAIALPAASVDRGKAEYLTRCASCHGEDLRGSENGPSLRGVGRAAVDFFLVTGRMPAALPWIEESGTRPPLAPGVIASIEDYVQSVATGGPAIPLVTAGGNLERGRTLFQQNCQQCHGVDGDGGSIGENLWAPSLHPASITQVAEAVRIGPGEMPLFGPHQLNEGQLRDVATYVFSLDRTAATTQAPLPTRGPVPEGLYGWLALSVLCVLAFAFSKEST